MLPLKTINNQSKGGTTCLAASIIIIIFQIILFERQNFTAWLTSSLSSSDLLPRYMSLASYFLVWLNPIQSNRRSVILIKFGQFSLKSVQSSLSELLDFLPTCIRNLVFDFSDALFSRMLCSWGRRWRHNFLCEPAKWFNVENKVDWIAIAAQVSTQRVLNQRYCGFKALFFNYVHDC